VDDTSPSTTAGVPSNSKGPLSDDVWRDTVLAALEAVLAADEPGCGELYEPAMEQARNALRKA